MPCACRSGSVGSSGALLEAQDMKRSLWTQSRILPSAQPCNLTLPLGDVGAQEASGEAEGTRLYCTCQAAERPVNFGLKMGGKNLAATVQQRNRLSGPWGPRWRATEEKLPDLWLCLRLTGSAADARRPRLPLHGPLNICRPQCQPWWAHGWTPSSPASFPPAQPHPPPQKGPL